MSSRLLVGVALLGLAALLASPVLAQPSGAPVSAPQGLWTNNPYRKFISELLPGQYQHSGIPSRALNTGGSLVGTPGRVAFDSAGDVWIPFCPDNNRQQGLVAALKPSALRSIAHNQFKGVAVAAELSLPSRCPRAAAFDQSGDLWISNGLNNGAIVEYAGSDLFSTGAQPAVVLTSDAFHNLRGLNFDGQGNLWVADEEAGVYEFTPEQLASGGSQTPQLTIQSSFLEAEDVAFDSAGNLWVAYLQGPPLDPKKPNALSSGAATEYASSDLAGSGTIAPAPAVTFSGPELCSPLDLCNAFGEAFDSSGNLWVSTGIALFAYSPQQQLTGGNPLATVTLSTNLFNTKGRGLNVRALNFEGNGFISFGPEIK